MRNRIVAHRGNAAECAENTIPAIRSAVELGVAYVEIDVQMSADAIPCLSHDSISAFPQKALAGRGVPSLDDAMAYLHDKGVVTFVEIKRDSFAKLGRERVVRDICGRLTEDCVVISFDFEAARIARRRGLSVGLVLNDLSPGTQREYLAIAPDYVFCDYRLLQQDVWPGSVWACYEITERSLATRLDAMGVVLFETMQVRRMMQ